MNHSPRQIFSPAARLAVLLLLLVPATSAWAYTVFFKNGSQITTREKYRIEGDKAILILPSGAEYFYDASEIDFEKTEEFNKLDLGTARLIDEGGETKRMTKEAPLDDEVTLEDLLRGRETGLALPERRQRRHEQQPDPEESAAAAPRTRAGFIDLLNLPRDPYPKPNIMAEVMRYLKGQGIDNVRLYRGSQPDRALVEIVAASEASVFKALRDSANSLVQIHQRFPDDVDAFELLLLTDNQVRAGQFTLTPELANQLATGELDPPNFFLRYVEF